MGRAAHRKTHTRVRVTFYSDDREIVVDGSHPEIGGIVSCTTSKAFGEAAGSFTFAIKRIPRLQPSFLTHFADPEDVYVHIEWLRDGIAYDGLWGLTDMMREDVVRQEDGTRVESITVTGQDLGKVLSKISLFVNIYEQAQAANVVLPMIPAYAAFENNLIGSPDQLVRTMLSAWLGNNGIADRQYMLPSSLQAKVGVSSVYDWLDLSTLSRSLRGMCFEPAMLNVEGQSRVLWDTLQEYSNPILNELWMDLSWNMDQSAATPSRFGKMRPALFHRERPFPTIKSRARWLALPSHVLKLEDVKARNIVSDGNERFNYWMLRAVSAQADDFAVQSMIQSSGGPRAGQPGNVPIYDLDSIRRHGLRKYEQSTRYLPINNSIDRQSGQPHADAIDWLGVARTWMRIVHDWYVTAPLQYTGSIITSYLRPEIRIGTRVLEVRPFTDETWEYYVEGVEHTYQFPGPGTTTLTLTRGQPSNAQFLTQHYAKYAGVDITTLTDVEFQQAATAEDAGAFSPTTPAVDPVTGNVVTDPVVLAAASRENVLSAERGPGAEPANGVTTPNVATTATDRINAIADSALERLLGDSASGVVTPPSPEEEAPVTEGDFTGSGQTSAAPEDAAVEAPIFIMEEITLQPLTAEQRRQFDEEDRQAQAAQAQAAAPRTTQPRRRRATTQTGTGTTPRLLTRRPRHEPIP